VDGRGDEVDVRGDMRGEVVCCAGCAGAASEHIQHEKCRGLTDVLGAGFVAVDMVLGVQQAFCLFYRDVYVHPPTFGDDAHAIFREAALGEPCADGGECGWVRGEGAGDVCGGPMVTVLWGGGVGDGEEEGVEFGKGAVGLGEEEAQGER
jgi:hypothetical protein